MHFWAPLFAKLHPSQKNRRRKRVYQLRNLRFELFEERRMLATFVVTNNADAPGKKRGQNGSVENSLLIAKLTERQHS